jgi:CBS domain-containing protein
MQVREAMSRDVLTVGPDHTLRAAAKLMASRNVGAAVVLDPELPGPAIITERDVLRSLGAGEDPDTERVATHMSGDVVHARPSWSLEEASVAMVRGGFRHLLISSEAGEPVGIVSVRDVVRVWTETGVIQVPESAAARF